MMSRDYETQSDGLIESSSRQRVTWSKPSKAIGRRAASDTPSNPAAQVGINGTVCDLRSQDDTRRKQVTLPYVPCAAACEGASARGMQSGISHRQGAKGHQGINQLSIPRMNWLNIHTPSFRKHEFTGSDPHEVGVWTLLMVYCCEQENGGKIRNCKEWTERQWLISCSVSIADVSRKSALWSWSATCLTVALYPIQKEREVAAKRAAGKATAKVRWARNSVAKNPPEKRVNGSSAHSSATSSAHRSADTEGEGEG